MIQNFDHICLEQFLKSSEVLHKMKATLEKLERDGKEDNTQKGPPENEFDLINWIDAFLPQDYKGKTISLLGDKFMFRRSK